jgi:hypothetical protein
MNDAVLKSTLGLRELAVKRWREGAGLSQADFTHVHGLIAEINDIIDKATAALMALEQLETSI